MPPATCPVHKDVLLVQRRRSIICPACEGRTPSKYGNIRTEGLGGTYDSLHEANSIGKVLLAERAGLAWNVERQKAHVLVPPFDFHGEHFRGIVYKSDVDYDDADGHHIIDCKSPATREKAEYKLKRTLMAVQGKWIEEWMNK